MLNNLHIFSEWSSNGVDIVTKPEYIVPVDENGYVTWDTKIRYEIQPSEYKVDTAYVVLIKDNNPILYIPSDITGTGFGALSRGFKFDKNSNYKAQVILNPGTGVEIKGEEVPISFVEIKMAVEKKDPDPDFTDVKLRWDDYYPALGDKTITIIGEMKPGNIDVMKVKCEVDPPIKDVEIKEPVVKTFKDGKARFKLSAPLATVPKTGEGDTVGIDEIQLKFTLLDVDVGILELVETWNVKNNSNTNLKEVLDGEAVFIYDASDDEHNIGHTEDWNVEDNAKKEFDVVQELFNQVVPRNRRVFNADNYDLMDENGIFDFKAKRALELFKEHFKVDNTTAGSDFKKLEKDYSFVDSSWANQIIGKKILMGKNVGDNQINASTDGDTGLYELYENVVEVFVNSMISKGNEYAQDTKVFKDRSGLDRTGISYSFGSNDSRQEYRDVATSETFAPSPYPNSEAPTEYPTTPPSMQYHDYRGDVGTIDSEKQYAGLISGEFINWIQNHYSSCDCNCDEKDHHFFPQHWAGVDCSGFAMRIINAADPTITQNNGVPPININVPNIAEAKYECNGGVRSYSNRLQVGDFFVSNHVKNIDLPGIGDDERTRFLKLLKKGDLMHYDGHISIVYSDRTTDAGYYEIIHAYGITPYVFPGTTKRLFSRKVMVTRENIGIPTGFGRIKLWN